MTTIPKLKSDYFAKIIESDQIQCNEPIRILKVAPPAQAASTSSSAQKLSANQINIKRGETAKITIKADATSDNVYWFKECQSSIPFITLDDPIALDCVYRLNKQVEIRGMC